jgi:hemerythrin
MPLPSWDEEFATGDPVIDAQHRDLLALVRGLEELDANGDPKPYFDLLDRVLDFTWSHFDLEERLMNRVEYPAAEHVEMTKQHEDFKTYARIRVLEFRFGQDPELRGFAPFLRDWLIRHEFGLDRKLADFIKVKKQPETAHHDDG